jgi:putative spermidine/putrescine transport system permease protein
VTLLGRVFTGLACLLLLGPIAVVVLASFSADSYLAFPPSGLSLRWYARFLGDPRWEAALINSLLTASMCCVISTPLGFLAGYAFVRGRLALRGALMSLML